MKQLYHNEDCTQFFYESHIPEGKAGEVVDKWVDVMADAGVTTFLLNTNARRTNYKSQAWESCWDGYDPAGSDDQPFLAPIPKDGVARFRHGTGNMLAVHQQGIDYPARVIQRCRTRGMSPWITLRMNDCHNNNNMEHPFHGSFWKKNPQFYRKNVREVYFARCLDYAHQEVRNYFMALIVETLERYDIDGLELDFMREPYLFSVGEEAAGSTILTKWLRDIRKRVSDAGVKRGHSIRLGVRVPSRPEVASAWGLDAITWARAGIIDLLVPTPRFETLEFDMPIRQWRELLGASMVTLAGGLEVHYNPTQHYREYKPVTPELAAGAAILVLDQGADAVYLFNYFQQGHPRWNMPDYLRNLNAMSSLDSLKKMPRTIGITFRDILAPGEKYKAPLPVTGKDIVLSMKAGPIPDNSWSCELLIGLAPSQNASESVPLASVNGKPCEMAGDASATEGQDIVRLITFTVPMQAFAENEVHEIRIVSQGQAVLIASRVEIAFRPTAGAV